MTLIFKGIATGIAFLSLPLQGFAAAGDFDTTFGDQGIFRFDTTSTSPAGGRALQLALQPSGGLIATGAVGDAAALLWITPDGRLDTSKYGSGRLLVSLQSRWSHGIAASAATDGRALLLRSDRPGCLGSPCTTQPDRVSVLQVDPSGLTDGGSGQIDITPGVPLVRPVVNLAADGNMYLVGFDPTRINPPKVMRLNAQGIEDLSFSALANSHAACGPDAAGPSAVLPLPNGRIMLYSISAPQLNDNIFCAVRLLQSGQVDTSFGSNGRVELRLSYPIAGYTQVLASGRSGDGRIHIVLKRSRNLQSDIADIIRLNDIQLSNARAESLPFAVLTAAAVDPSGRVLLAGYEATTILSQGTTQFVYRITRVLDNGTIDSVFRSSSNPLTGLQIGQNTFSPIAIQVAADGSIFLAGAALVSGSTTGQFAVAKLQADSPPGPPPPAQSSGGGGGGCGTLNGKGPADPTLPLLAMLALMALYARRRLANIRHQSGITSIRASA